MFSPASERNKGPIRDQLRNLLPSSGTLIEIACGSLQHACFIAPEHPKLSWLPSDINSEALAYGSKLAADNRLPDNVSAPVRLDIAANTWPLNSPIEVIYTANLLHISPWAATEGLMRHAASHLAKDGQLLIYGPFSRSGQHNSAGNQAFDADLRQRDPSWGIRDLDDIEALTASLGFRLSGQIEMPANNFLLQFIRTV